MKQAIRSETHEYRRVDGRALELTITRPDRAGPFPLLVDLHGGAWTHFDRHVNFYLCEWLARRGFATASVEFRLAPEHPWPAFFEDVQSAARWLRSHAPALGLDATTLGAIGGSTGGHLATLLGLLPGPTVDGVSGGAEYVIALYPILDVPGRYDLVRSARFDFAARSAAGLVRSLARRRAGVAAGDRSSPKVGAGPTPRLRALARLRERRPLVGDAVTRAVQAILHGAGKLAALRALEYPHLVEAHEGAFASIEEMTAASPLHIVRQGLTERRPPILILQGDVDPNMTPAMTCEFADAYRARGGRVDARFLRGHGHGFVSVPSALTDRVLETALDFARTEVDRGRAERSPRRLGEWRGKLNISADFDETPAEVIALFEGAGTVPPPR